MEVHIQERQSNCPNEQRSLLEEEKDQKPKLTEKVRVAEINHHSVSEQMHKISEIFHHKERAAEELALLIAGIGVMYFFWGVFGMHFNISLFMILSSLGFYILKRIQRANREGIVNKVSPGVRKLLLGRSLFDILCDLWYFPILPKYIKAILGPFIFKPTPEEAAKAFDELHPSFKSFFFTKGIINILPNKAKNFLLPDDLLEVNPDEILDTQSTRDNSDTHSNPSPNSIDHQIPIIRQKPENQHNTISIRNKNKHHKKQPNLHLKPGDTKLICCGQQVQDEIKRQKVMNCLQGAIIQKYDKALQYHIGVAVKESSSTFLQDPKVFLMKFLKGSKNVTSADKMALRKALFLAGFALGIQLYFSKRSRQWLKQTLLLSLYLASSTIGASSLLLLYKHHKNSINKPNEETVSD